MFAVGADELVGRVSGYTTCPNCGEQHKVLYGDKVEKDGTLTPSKMLGYVKCTNESSYLVAIGGKGFKK